ncbi:hypothetical protein NQ315_012860 [Exocentrus adspersus]|uniref:Uncharacterized protein n=1 Tax=Exocentrus adspersus TaxID=1586481 RepID=A0AAV8VGQ0_9CUCU|nr:hypothetical protein NQ315_012860 [Exocentrus adspersus]
MARHFEQVNSNLVDVARILAMDNSKRRKEAFSELIRSGDFNHNCEVLSLKDDKIRSNEIGECCVKDEIILQFGGMLYEKYDVTQCELIRQSMRQLGFHRRLLVILKQITNNSDVCLLDFLRPEKFDIIVEATKILCVNKIKSQKRQQFDIPSLVLKIGYSLKKCASIERDRALKQMNLKQNQILFSFLKVMELEWSLRISSNAHSTLYKRKINQTQLLPLTTDLIKLNTRINIAIPEYQEKLNISPPTIENWQQLARYTLARIIILFNKRRSGEAARMTTENDMSRLEWSEQTTEETRSCLTSFEKKLTERLIIVEIEGKRGRKVPVLLTSDTKKSIYILIQLREQYGIARSYNEIGKGNLAKPSQGCAILSPASSALQGGVWWKVQSECHRSLGCRPKKKVGHQKRKAFSVWNCRLLILVEDDSSTTHKSGCLLIPAGCSQTWRGILVVGDQLKISGLKGDSDQRPTALNKTSRNLPLLRRFAGSSTDPVPYSSLVDFKQTTIQVLEKGL